MPKLGFFLSAMTAGAALAVLAFFISGAVTFALDLIFKTHVSIPAMIDALDLTHWVAARLRPLIQSVREVELEPVSPMTRNVRLLGLSAVAAGTVAVTLFPLTTWAMIGVRNLNH
jgi:hypothetical protein